MRRSAVAGLCLTLIIGPAGVASAGGSVWEFDGEYQPGDIVVSATTVAWSHDRSLGRPEDGPYLIYLAPTPEEDLLTTDVPAEAMLVGVVEIVLGPLQAEDGEWYGPNQAIARFEIPDVAPGTYHISHCNHPCTTTVGDVIGGWGLSVVAGSRGRTPESIAGEVMASLVSYQAPSGPIRSGGESGIDATRALDETMSPALLTRPEAGVEDGLVPDPSPARSDLRLASTDPGGSPRQAEPDGRWDTSWAVVIAVSLGIGLINLVRWQIRPVRPTSPVTAKPAATDPSLATESKVG